MMQIVEPATSGNDAFLLTGRRVEAVVRGCL